MNIFISYTTRNNEVTLSLLANFSNKISSFGKVFIDLIDNKSRNRQNRIIKELNRANILILIKSESTLESEWVLFELDSANKRNVPIIEFNIFEVKDMSEREIKKRICSSIKTDALPLTMA